jgi:hypothetical protein
MPNNHKTSEIPELVQADTDSRLSTSDTTGTIASVPNALNTKSNDQFMRMQWCVLMSIVASIIIMLITKNLFPLAIPSSLVLIMRPIVKFLFSTPPKV